MEPQIFNLPKNDPYQLSLSPEDFVAAVSARLPVPENPQDRKLITALRILA
jgi:hypothetical protein